MTMISAVNSILAWLTVLGQIISAVLIFALVFRQERITGFFGKRAVMISSLIAFIAMLGSLFYSEIAGYEPCRLCWYQRILMYPLVVLFITAFFKKDKNILGYGFVLSSVGVFIAGYHYLLQLGAVPNLPCSAVGYSVSCAQRFVMQFGYITIPMMALTAFLTIVLLALAGRRTN